MRVRNARKLNEGTASIQRQMHINSSSSSSRTEKKLLQKNNNRRPTFGRKKKAKQKKTSCLGQHLQRYQFLHAGVVDFRSVDDPELPLSQVLDNL